MAEQKRHTSSDVARLAGVSQATVSRAFNNPAYVTLETRNRILDAARRLNYTPNAIAKSLVSQRTNLIGLIMADIANPFYTGLMDRLSEALVAQGRSCSSSTAPRPPPWPRCCWTRPAFRWTGW